MLLLLFWHLVFVPWTCGGLGVSGRAWLRAHSPSVWDLLFGTNIQLSPGWKWKWDGCTCTARSAVAEGGRLFSLSDGAANDRRGPASILPVSRVSPLPNFMFSFSILCPKFAIASFSPALDGLPRSPRPSCLLVSVSSCSLIKVVSSRLTWWFWSLSPGLSVCFSFCN